jgi:hypothetical protein
MGRVAVAYSGNQQEVGSSSAQISTLRLLDEAALLNQLAMNMLSQALLSNEIPSSDREEARSEYLQVVSNLIRVMGELDLCEGAVRRLDRAFNQAALVPPNATQQITGLRRGINDCRTRVQAERPGWNTSAFREVIGEAISSFNTAESIPIEQQAIRESRFFESLQSQEHGISMLLAGFDGNEFRRDRDVAGAQGDLFHLYEASVRSMLELGLRVSAEAQIEEIIDRAGTLPDEALSQATELGLMLNAENERYAEEHQLGGALRNDAPWDYERYQQILILAQRLYTVTRGGSMPTDDGGDTGNVAVGTGDGTGDQP